MVNGATAADAAGWSLISAVAAGAKGPDDGAQPLVREMIVVHNVMIRCISSIYLQCVNVEKSPQDVADFVEFCKCWGESVSMHHHEEETDVFPGIEKLSGQAGLMEGNVEQHHAFHPGLEKYIEYLAEVKEGKTKYEGQKLKDIIESFMPALHAHLHDEIKTLIDLKRYTNVDWKDYWSKKSEEIVGKAMQNPRAKDVLMPFMLSCHDVTFEDGVLKWWPAMPWIAKLMFRFWFNSIHKAWWRFAPCDANSKPKDLPFA